ncbi:Glutamate 5-kinase [Candidatus Magnetaquicoccaceae bacterium FCR-1]|uniref:Glutamate 5-kinase n=1 Tax=Candidatus Magnetaquiglobus chichijimensis TaxID=3141448 RepID=A0ABQ0CBZ7_9PROT
MASSASGCVDHRARLSQEWQAVRGARRVVVKIGSNLLTGGGEGIRPEWIAARAREIVRVMADGRRVIVVTSGAVAAGRPLLKLNRPLASVQEKQAAAAAGQGVLMRHYEEAFESLGVNVAQALLTRDDVENRQRYLNARDTLKTLLELGLVPIVNENDTVMTDELKFGDNDTLSANVADLVDADLLILLSDIDGLYDSNPRLNPEARFIPLVERVTPEIESMAGGVGSLVGKGGMATKIKAARMAARSGCRMVLTNGFRENPISEVFTPFPVGTLFLGLENPLPARKRWIVNARVGRGEILLDAGASVALLQGRSLLAKGITAVLGEFARGAVVHCQAPDGQELAKGIVNYNSSDLACIAGRHSRQFEGLLGYLGAEEVIHRDNLVLIRELDAEG